MNPEDLELLDGDQAPVVDDPTPQEDPKPDPVAEALRQLSEQVGRLAAPKPAEVAPEPDPEPENYGFDPDRIVGAARQQATQGAQVAAKTTYQVMRKVESELHKNFGDKLKKDDLEAIIDQISNMPVENMAVAVNEQNAHLVLADAMYGKAVREGRINPSAKPQSKPTPIGGDAPPARKTQMESEFEKMFGKMDASTAKRLQAQFDGGPF